ncbi:MAG: 5-oxoprolinase (ATP-hydrolyzing) subunit [Bacillota bacterium]|nr:5-oxoprolinase (ATP-hydrolyzing) subunit [Bacillota bacterium]
MVRVDLNSDVGESFGAYKLGLDAEVLKHVTSANIACGLHAGDPMVMAKTVALAAENGVGVGAHPGYPDLQGFGRRNMNLTPDEVKNFVIYQVGALAAFARAAGRPLQHVKAHGALYNMAAKDAKLARAIAEGVKAAAPDAILLALAGSEMVKAAREVGLKVAQEVFADRAYNPDGTLVPRSQPGSMIHDPEVAIPRAVRMVTEGKVTAITGEEISIQADSICVHGDNPEAIAFVARIRDALAAAGVEVVPLAQVIER